MFLPLSFAIILCMNFSFEKILLVCYNFISGECIAERCFIGIGGSCRTSHIISQFSPESLPCIWVGEVLEMKRVKAACVLQTLVFMQKEDCGLSRESIRNANRQEVSRYKQSMDRSHIRYQIVSEEELDNGSILVRVRKQYNDKADVAEYFQ